MASLPKPLIGLLLGTVVFFALWMVALKPSSSSSSGGGSQGGVGQYQSAINAAHGAVATSNQANAQLGAPTATAPAPKPATRAKATPVTPATASPAAKPAAATKSAAAAKPAQASKSTPSAPPSAAAAVATVQNAIRVHKVLAVLFYNPAAADDQAMKSELAAVPTHGGNVVKLAVPVSELTQFGMITQQVPVDTSPTLIVIDRARRAATLTGYASTVEITQRIDNALASK
jgi:hypothetical protein